MKSCPLFSGLALAAALLPAPTAFGGGDWPIIQRKDDVLCEYWNKLAGGEWNLAVLAHQQREETKGRKALMADEFGLGSMDNLRNLMRVIREEGISGGLLWSIRSHRRDGGWFYHNEGGTPINSYHVPGFAAGYAYEETRTLDLLRCEAYAIRGLPVPAVEKPEPAPMLFYRDGGFTWRGSTGAACYTLERAESPNGPWAAVAVGLPDSVVADARKHEESTNASPTLLWHEESVPAGKPFFYRVKGLNAGGETDYSNHVQR